MKIIFTVVSILCFAITTNAQQQATDSLEGQKVVLDEVFVSAIRVTKATPVTFSNLTKEQIKPRNLGQDIPILMNFLPSVVTTSDAGAGVGYTGIRVRGSDATRVNVTINGIPYNDSESHGTFWVNMPDFASSTESLQLQRGVGSSTNGAGAFGASLNVLTDAISQDAYAQISSSIGSFKTLRNTLKFSTGLLNDQIEISGRLSQINSDGYIDRATSDLESYFLQAAYKDDNTLIKALLFGGHEVTYQAWYGTPLARINNNAQGIEDFIAANGLTESEAENLRNSDRRYNYYTYENEEDNYKQNHAQLLWNETLNDNWSTNLALHYTKGRGYFEQFKADDDFDTYGFIPVTVDGEEVNTTDVIRRRWLDNDFYGTVFSANYNKENVDLILGGGWNKYEGDHFGEVIWARYASTSNIRDRYYDDNSTKTDFNIFSKINYKLDDQWSLFGDLQYRTVGYEANGDETGLVDDTFNFFNPKAGITFDLNSNNNFYFSYAVANREPNRNDYESGNPKPERLNDFELGWRYISNTLQLNTNVYYMGYKDQLVLTGALNDVGAPLRENVGDSYRLGLEVEANVSLGAKFAFRPNITLSANRNKDFVFQRDGALQNLGDTEIAFSPSVIVGGALVYMPTDNLQLSLLGKHVGEQYMGNIDASSSKLEAYSQFDFNVQYEIVTNSFIKSIVLSGLVNNIFNELYESNGYFFTFDDTWSTPGVTTTIEGAGYYPQAGTNFLVGATLNF
ncbi:TonB-dependent receptor [Cellulophaga sp. E16_2]|uniref:TonB-dependent receptor n=1 Tax=Cellulophaga sp. E16_2 TaxID=2789297 RepID=UPI001A92028C|nr:TonB-dependent receptor [Cellulophaga sp. E16_2]MBO0590807.1 TonB-dependent receptor [Cellulophaga sp. E16_2]